MKIYQQEIINSVAAYEAECGHDLPVDSFFKSLALRFMRESPAPACTFCGQSAADLPTADWPMCAACYNAVAALDNNLCDLLF